MVINVMHPLSKLPPLPEHSVLPQDSKVVWPENFDNLSTTEVDSKIKDVFARVHVLQHGAPQFASINDDWPALHHRSIRYLKEELQELTLHNSKVQALHSAQTAKIATAWSGENHNLLVQLTYYICKSFLLWQSERQFSTLESSLQSEIQNIEPDLKRLTSGDIRFSQIRTFIACRERFREFYVSLSTPDAIEKILHQSRKVLELDPDDSQGLILSFSSSQMNPETQKSYTVNVYIRIDEAYDPDSFSMSSQEFTPEYTAQAEYPSGILSPVITHNTEFENEPLELHTLLSKTSTELEQIFNLPSKTPSGT
jgi:hypothetical protein